MSADALAIEEPLSSRGIGTEPWPLPRGWIWVPLGDLSSVVSRGRAPEYVGEGGVAVLNQKCVRWDKVDFKFAKRSSEAAFQKYPDHLVVRDGDILWNSTGSGTIGRAAIYQQPHATGNSPVVVDTHITLVRCEQCLPSYVHRFLSTLHVQKAIPDLNVGSTNQLELPRAAVLNLRIPLPPSPEQQRIVARIDELFAEIAEGEAALKRARHGLDTWRRALLKAAVTGELTRDWREANPPTETGADLLARIRPAVDAASPRSRRQQSTALPRVFDTSSLPELPKNWVWARWQDVGISQNGRAFPSAEYSTTGIKLLRPGNLFADGTVKWTDHNTRHMPENFAEVNRDLIINGPELVINLTAQSLKDEFLGRVCITSAMDRCLLNQRIARLTPFGISKEYMLIVLKSPLFRNFIVYLNTGSLIQHMFTSQLDRFAFPLPPEAEQHVIVQQVKDRIDAIVDVATNGDAQGRPADELRQSILKSAFEGRLVPQDPADEPASALLARERERDALVGVVPRRRRRAPGGAQGALAL